MDSCTGFRDCIAGWAEPLSWLAAIVALVVASVTLYVAWVMGLPQLRYIRKALEHQPKVETRLARKAQDDKWEFVLEEAFTPTWSGGSASDPITVRCCTTNWGEQTARDLTLRYVLPANPEVQPTYEAVEVDRPELNRPPVIRETLIARVIRAIRPIRVQSADEEVETVEVDHVTGVPKTLQPVAGATNQFALTTMTLNPRDGLMINFELRLPRGLAEIQVKTRISDASRTPEVLKVHVVDKT